MNNIESVELFEQFEQTILDCNTKDEAREAAKVFILNLAKNNPNKQIMFLLSIRYRYLIRWFNTIKEKSNEPASP